MHRMTPTFPWTLNNDKYRYSAATKDSVILYNVSERLFRFVYNMICVPEYNIYACMLFPNSSYRRLLETTIIATPSGMNTREKQFSLTHLSPQREVLLRTVEVCTYTFKPMVYVHPQHAEWNNGTNIKARFVSWMYGRIPNLSKTIYVCLCWEGLIGSILNLWREKFPKDSRKKQKE